MSASNLVLIIATTCVALVAGLLYSYSCSVMPGLKSLPGKEFILVMQSINRAIQNPVFFIPFFGALLLLPMSTYMNFSHPVNTRFWLLIATTILYIVGVFGVTVIGNIPLNTTLDKFDVINATKEAVDLQRINFESRWIAWHTVRTVCAVLSLVLIIIACINPGKDL